MKKIIIYISLLIPQITLAANTMNSRDFSWSNPIGSGSFPELIYAILDAVVKIGAIFVVLFVVYAGYLFVTARGNPEKINSAKSTLFYTLIGAVILLGAEAIAQVVCNTANELGADVRCLMR